ncbi:hypothetical protein SESBI_07950 [Sesbania bispinosa]|nr:hypothetical protein SESBI_07950 [Sesbania bispinosa]
MKPLLIAEYFTEASATSSSSSKKPLHYKAGSLLAPVSAQAVSPSDPFLTCKDSASADQKRKKIIAQNIFPALDSPPTPLEKKNESKKIPNLFLAHEISENTNAKLEWKSSSDTFIFGNFSDFSAVNCHRLEVPSNVPFVPIIVKSDSVLLPLELFVKSSCPASEPKPHSIHNAPQFALTVVLLGVRSSTTWFSSYSDCVLHPQLSNHHQVLNKIPHGKHIHHVLQLVELEVCELLSSYEFPEDDVFVGNAIANMNVKCG